MTVARHMAAMAHSLGLPAFLPESDGSYRVLADDMELRISGEPMGRIRLQVDVATLPQPAKELDAFTRSLLSRGAGRLFSCGAVLALDQARGVAILHRQIDGTVAPREFLELVGQMCDAGAWWRAESADLSAGRAESRPPSMTLFP